MRRCYWLGNVATLEAEEALSGATKSVRSTLPRLMNRIDAPSIFKFDSN